MASTTTTTPQPQGKGSVRREGQGREMTGHRIQRSSSGPNQGVRLWMESAASGQPLPLSQACAQVRGWALCLPPPGVFPGSCLTEGAAESGRGDSWGGHASAVRKGCRAGGTSVWERGTSLRCPRSGRGQRRGSYVCADVPAQGAAEGRAWRWVFLGKCRGASLPALSQQLAQLMGGGGGGGWLAARRS